MKIIKYSKSYEQIFKIKKNFYVENNKNLNSIKKINKFYSKQKKRIYCKNCEKKLGKPTFLSFGVDYTVCNNCSHLNGANQDTSKFVNWLYTENSGDNYAYNYTKKFNSRVNSIYKPKVKFLREVIKEKINILDLGSGAGHFIKACELYGLKADGIEPSAKLSNIANKKLKKNKSLNIQMSEIKKFIKGKKKYNVISMISVLEHLDKPNEILKSIKNSKIKYIYLSVPLFSLTSFIENSFKNVFPRQLSAAHTHLYTKKSLNFMARKYNFKIVGEWWFGTDLPDLYRSLLVSSSAYKKKEYEKLLNQYFYNSINQLQAVLDKKKICSEVHLILKNKL